MKSRVRKRIILLLIFALTLGFVMEAEALTIRYRFSVRVSQIAKRPYLDTKKLTLYKKCYDVLVLENASKNVSWSTSNKKVVRLKKKGNKVEVYWKKKGKCTVRARYRGKTYSCKITCKGINPNAVEVDYADRTVYMAGAGDFNDATIYVYTDNTSVDYYIQDPSIVDCEWGEWEWDEDEYAWKIDLSTKALKPGRTTVIITNSHNKKERDYITIDTL